MTPARAALARLFDAPDIIKAAPPILLPAGPYFDLAGEEFGRRLLLTIGNDGVEYCLRPDFTLPIAQAWLAGGKSAAAYAYLGPVFRQRTSGPAEFEQAGLELVAQPDAGAALDRVFGFALDALAAYAVARPAIRLGSVGMFEALLAAADMPEVWRPRIRHRFGHPESIGPLLARLSDPHGANGNIRARSRAALIEEVTGRMVAAGLSLTEGRRPDEIADRFVEKQALAAAHVPGETIDLLSAYLAISGPAGEALAAIGELAGGISRTFEDEMAAVAAQARALAQRAPGAAIRFDAGFSPRLDYYTGTVFEIAGTSGRVLASGGQYDRLLQRLGSPRQVAASGCAVWVERLEAEARP